MVLFFLTRRYEGHEGFLGAWLGFFIHRWTQITQIFLGRALLGFVGTAKTPRTPSFFWGALLRPQVAGRMSRVNLSCCGHAWLAIVRVQALPGCYFGVRVTRAALCAGRGTAFRPVHAKAASRGIPLAAALQIFYRACEAPGGASVCLTGRAVRGERSTGFPTRATDRNVRAPVAWASGSLAGVVNNPSPIYHQCVQNQVALPQ
jgi:hypothetical protein